MIEVDRIMLEDYNIPLELMMENAGLALARIAAKYLDSAEKSIGIVVGSGNNGGGGLVAARRLHSWGFDVHVIIPKGIEAFKPVPRMQWQRAKSLGVRIAEGLHESLNPRTLRVVIDAYIGYGYTKRVDSLTTDVTDFLSNHTRVVSLDAPTGLNVTTGEMSNSFRPHTTLTIAFPKIGLLKGYPDITGDLFVCDIGVPSEVYRSSLGVNWNPPYAISWLETLSTLFGESQTLPVNVSYSKETDAYSWVPIRKSMTSSN
ncbi:MAG: NAD(P)H-hydrate epimerase [Candidatus Thorarchaeota archaeon]